ncbi:MAG: AraC family ligand binding domain-containing protein [Gemmatimonadaceae bacterium]
MHDGATSTTPADYFSASALAALGDELLAAGVISRTLGDHGRYRYVLVCRARTAAPEQHTRWTDVMMVQGGSATLITGGALADASEPAEGELSGREIIGGDSRRVSAGDLVVIPAGVPHQVQLGDGESVRYLTIKVPPPSAVP